MLEADKLVRSSMIVAGGEIVMVLPRMITVSQWKAARFYVCFAGSASTELPDGLEAGWEIQR